MKPSTIVLRHVLPTALGAAAAFGAHSYAALIAKTGPLALRTALSSAALGAIAAIFYTATADLLEAQLHLPTLATHAIAVITSALVTCGVAFAAAAAGLFVMPPLTTLGALFSASIASSILFRALFPGEQRTPSVPQPTPAALPTPPPPAPPGGPFSMAWSWPTDLNSIGMNTHVRADIDTFLKEVQASARATGKLPDFHRKNEGFLWNNRYWNLPRTLTLMVDAKTKALTAILLNVSKNQVPILGKGGFRTAKVCYNLMSGERLVKKKAENDEEVELLKKLNGSKGIEPLLFVRKVPAKPGKTRKTHLITPLFQGSLHALFKTCPSFSAKDVRDMMGPLLEGLEKFHQSPTVYSLNSKPYHADLKPLNLLYRHSRSGYDAVITDWGSANTNVSTYGWASPNKANLWHRGLTASLYKTGQADDIWSMGLIFAALLKNQLHNDTTAPLPCIYGKLLYDDRAIAYLTQHEVEQDIAKLKMDDISKPDGAERGKMWDIVSQMLRVDPAGRLKAKAAKQLLAKV